MGRDFRGVYHLLEDCLYLYTSRDGSKLPETLRLEGLDSDAVTERLGVDADRFREEIELIRGASDEFDPERYLEGRQTPVFCGAAIHNFGVKELLDSFVEHAPAPLPRATQTRIVQPDEPALTGFVFKIQANMDPAHRDRIAFMRICSGRYTPGKKMYHTRLKREIRISDAITFMAADRQH